MSSATTRAAEAHPGALDSVTVVVVTYNSERCVPALAAGLGTLPHVIVVDNASHDDTVAHVNRALPQARVLRNTENQGFGRANNRGLAEVRTPYALLLNPDCEITAEQIGELLAEAARWPEAAMLGPQLLESNGQPGLNYRWATGTWSSRGPGAEATTCVGFLVGAAWLMNLRHFEGIGHFDPRFFLYYEDDDLCLRLFRSGKPMLLVPGVRVLHRSRSSSGSRRRWRTEYLRGYHHAQSKIIFQAKHGQAGNAQSLRWRTLLLAVPLVLLRVLTLSPRHTARALGRLVGLLTLKTP